MMSDANFQLWFDVTRAHFFVYYESLFANKIDSNTSAKHQHRKAQKEKKQHKKHNYTNYIMYSCTTQQPATHTFIHKSN